MTVTGWVTFVRPFTAWMTVAGVVLALAWIVTELTVVELCGKLACKYWAKVWLGAVAACTSAANSDVLPLGSVAVTLIHWPARLPTDKLATKVALPLASVVTVVAPRYV